MERAIAEQLVNAGQDIGLELELYEDYSGRGMYGSTTTGIQADRVTDLIAAAYAAGVDAEACGEVLNIGLFAERLRTDSLGLGVIVY